MGHFNVVQKKNIPSGRAADICFHDLRHYAARRLVKKTDVVTAQKILDWKTLDMVRRYVHPTDEDRRLAERTSQAVSNGRRG